MRVLRQVLSIFSITVSAYSRDRRSFSVLRFFGKDPLTTARIDPIVSPGHISSHVHIIQGGNAFDFTMSDTQTLTSTCTSAKLKNDKSNYWVPALYFMDPKNGQFEAVELSYMNVYYFFDSTTDHIMAFQPGHRMFVGNSSLRQPPATGGRSIIDIAEGDPQPIQWTCPRHNTRTELYSVLSDGMHGLGIQDPMNAGSGVGFPDKQCDGTASPLRADIHFPSCYDPRAGLRSYQNNMRYPTNGNCPRDWIHTPHLFYEVYWDTQKFSDRWIPGRGSQPFVLANGDSTGYSLHGDFISGWDPEALQQIIDNCDTGTSGMDMCHVPGGEVSDYSSSCTLQSPVQENMRGPMDNLPGDNPIHHWGI